MAWREDSIKGVLDFCESEGQPAESVERLAAAAQKVVEAGPFYDGVDDGFCAVCGAYFTTGEDHKPDCAYVALREALTAKLWDPHDLR